MSCSYEFSFENPDDSIFITIDTISNPSNIWQIGNPQKTVFTTSTFGGIAMVTDTINTYPINDTSIFILVHPVCWGFVDYHFGALSGMYYVHTDSLNDYGKIEFSPDNGNNWILISEDTLQYNSTSWPTYSPKGTFTGSSNGWKNFFIVLPNLYEIFGFNYGDTVLFKFSFISDGNAESMDGLMFDNIKILDEEYWGIDEIHLENFNVFPNPATTEIQIKNLNTPIEIIKIYSMDGRLVYAQSNPNQNSIPIEFLESGTYQILVETNDGKFLTGRFIKL